MSDDTSSSVKREKKSKKESKKRKHEEEEQETTPAVKVEAEPEPEVEQDESKKSKKEKKAKKKQKREEAEEEDTSAVPASSSSSKSALSSLADEIVVLNKDAMQDDEPVDLLALKKKKNSKMMVHASRAGGAGADDTAASSSGFVPDENATVISEPVRIFCGNLPFKITDELMHECFDEFGKIVGIHWVTDKATGNFYGTGFVDFESAESAKAALVRNGVEILGRAIKVNVATGANVAGKNRFNTKEKKGGHLAKLPISEKPQDCNTVFLGNLSFTIDDKTIREVFQPCGEITDVRWVEKDGEFKGCGFVEFAESWSTDEAVKLNGADVMGRPMRVDYSARGSR